VDLDVENSVTPSEEVNVGNSVAPSEEDNVGNLPTPSEVAMVVNSVTLSEVVDVENFVAPSDEVDVENLYAPTEEITVGNSDAPSEVVDVENSVTPSEVVDVENSDAPSEEVNDENTDAPSEVVEVEDSFTPSKVVSVENSGTPTDVVDVENSDAPSVAVNVRNKDAPSGVVDVENSVGSEEVGVENSVKPDVGKSDTARGLTEVRVEETEATGAGEDLLIVTGEAESVDVDTFALEAAVELFKLSDEDADVIDTVVEGLEVETVDEDTKTSAGTAVKILEVRLLAMPLETCREDIDDIVDEVLTDLLVAGDIAVVVVVLINAVDTVPVDVEGEANFSSRVEILVEPLKNCVVDTEVVVEVTVDLDAVT